ncbi:MAG TPA: DUF3106 domain-containing protein [Verrucomicrobiae bacterium]
MTCTRHLVFWLAALVGLRLVTGLSSAQDAIKPAHSNASPADLARLSPLLPLNKNPVALFRQLLEMSEAERARFEATYSPEKRAAIAAKIKEYEKLSPDERELRLRVTELQYYLLPLMGLPSTNRPAQIALLPPEIAPMVAVRLQRWDELPADEQNRLLDNQTAVRHLTAYASINPRIQAEALGQLTPAQREALKQGLDKWRRLTEDQRQEITARFQEFFNLTPPEEQKTLRTLSQAERTQIARTVRVYSELNPKSRARILGGLDKFCRLTPTEFKEFLGNVERWQMLTPTARKAWRDLVISASIQPPLPPGARPRPSMPPLPSQARAPAPVATNH